MNLVTSKLIGISICLVLLFESYTNVKALTGQTMTSTAAQPLAASAVYYVAPAGSDSNAGSVSSPFLTIQKCLNVVQVGNTCNISAGTYNESLTIKTSGAAGSPITIQSYNGPVSVNSGSSVTVTSGTHNYYVFSGVSFISSFGSGGGEDSGGLTENLNFKGASNITLQNCSDVGMVYFNGSNNTVTNCIFNGTGYTFNDAVHFYTGSNNTVEATTVHNYTVRGIWTGYGSINSLIEGNTVYNVQHGVDCDGASVAVQSCKVVGNTIYDAGVGNWGSGIFLEDSFNGLVQGNTVYSIVNGAGIYVVNYGNGGGSSGWVTQGGVEYRSQNTNTTISGNLIYSYPTNPCFLIMSANGLTINHNTCANGTNSGPSLWLRFTSGTTFYPVNEVVTNNIFYSPSASYATQLDNAASEASTFTNNLYDAKAAWKVASTTYSLAQVQAMGYEKKSLSADPNFINVSLGDYSLQAGSPASSEASDGGTIGALGPIGNAPTATLSVTSTPTYTPTVLATMSSITPTLTATPTASHTPLPPTFTPTPHPATATPTASHTPLPPTFTPTPHPATATPTASHTPLPPTFTPTPHPATPTQQVSETTYDDFYPDFMFSSSWPIIDNSQAYDGHYKYTGLQNSSVSLAFTGQSFSVVYTAGPSYGTMAVYVDNKMVGSINEQSSSLRYQQHWNYAGQLSGGTHTLKLVFTGPANTEGTLDAVIVG
jgi:hypothetical protein